MNCGSGGAGDRKDKAALPQRTCLNRDPPPRRALPASCPALQAPVDGRKFGTKYLVEHEVHFTCDPGFQLLGSSTRTCQANGSWTGQEPHCAGTAPGCLRQGCRAAGRGCWGCFVPVAA